MSVENDLIFLKDFKKEKESDESLRENKKRLKLKKLQALIEKGLYRPDCEDVAQSLLEAELTDKPKK